MSECLEVATVGELLIAIGPGDLHAPLESAAWLEKSVGGAEVNVVLGLARLGHRVAWTGALGDDPFGREGLRALRGEGVDVSGARVTPSATTGVYFKELLPGGGLRNYPYRDFSAASRLTYADLDIEHLLSARVLHLTGITALISTAGHDIVARLIADARTRGVHVSFDVNLRRHLLRDRDVAALLMPLVRGADTVFLSRSEAGLLFPDTEPGGLQALLPTLRAQTVIVHDAGGAVAVTRDEVIAVNARVVDLVDPTGAGDAIVAGYLSGWLEGISLTARLGRAEHCAAQVVASRGDSSVTMRRAGTTVADVTEAEADR